MEFQINLLPQTYTYKEKRSLYLILVLGIAAVLIAASVVTYSYFDKKESVQQLSEQITAETAARDQLITKYQDSTAGVTSFTYKDKYQSMNQLLSTTYVSTDAMHDRIRRLFPVKAKMVDYAYANNGELAVKVNFFSKGDSAIYLDRLLTSSFVQSAQLVNIVADEEDFTYDASFEIELKTLAGVDQ